MAMIEVIYAGELSPELKDVRFLFVHSISNLPGGGLEITASAQLYSNHYVKQWYRGVTAFLATTGFENRQSNLRKILVTDFNLTVNREITNVHAMYGSTPPPIQVGPASLSIVIKGAPLPLLEEEKLICNVHNITFNDEDYLL